jgi:hypothetical protein
MRRAALLGLAALTAVLSADAAPASAQGFRLYPWCAVGTRGGATSCYFSTLQQCQAAVRGAGGQCVVNSWYTAYGPNYSYGRRRR